MTKDSLTKNSIESFGPADPDRSRSVLKLLFDQSSDPICLLDEKKKILFVNESAQNLFQKLSLFDKWPSLSDNKKLFVNSEGLFTPFPFYNYFLLPINNKMTRFCLLLKKNELYLPEQKNWFLTRKENELLDFFRNENLTDPLTALPDRSIQFSKLFDFFSCDGTLIFCDINRLKQINDTRGHSFGDRVLKSVAVILGQYFPAPSLPARYGGDEFLIYAPKLSPQEGQTVLDSSVTNALDATACNLNLNFPIRLDYGLAPFQQEDQFDAVFQKADADFYRRKKDLQKNQ